MDYKNNISKKLNILIETNGLNKGGNVSENEYTFASGKNYAYNVTIKYCPQCGKPKFYSGMVEENTVGKTYCTCVKLDGWVGGWGEQKNGWICPRCNRVNSPYLDHCDCNNWYSGRTFSGG